MVSLIVAMSENRVIGRQGGLPWRLSADLQMFKRLTMGHHLIMGRRTYDSIGRPLPGRTTIVLSRTSDWNREGITVARTWDEVWRIVADDPEPFVVGGAEVFLQSLPWVDRLYVTQVHAQVPGDTYFPVIDWARWQLISSDRHGADNKNEFDYSFQMYQLNSNAFPSFPRRFAMQEIIDVTDRLLKSVATADWATYEQLCDSTLTAFEPEARGHLVEGLDFHRFYFTLGSSNLPQQTTMIQPHVRMLGDDVAIISYNRLVQKVGPQGAITHCSEETRVWQRKDGAWKHVHFHRSLPS